MYVCMYVCACVGLILSGTEGRMGEGGVNGIDERGGEQLKVCTYEIVLSDTKYIEKNI